jgi:hypothetical protein
VTALEQGPARGCGSEAGAVLIELCFVVPILLILSIFTIEFIKIMEQKQMISVLNREVTSQVFRECAWARGGAPTGCPDDAGMGVGDPATDERMRCIERFRVGLETLGFNIFQRRPEAIFSVYQKCGGGVRRITVEPNGGVTYVSGNPSKYTEASPDFTTPQFRELLDRQNRVVIGEVYLEYGPILTANIPHVWRMTQWLYDVTKY